MATDRFNIRQGDTNQFGFGIAANHYPIDAEAFARTHSLPTPLFGTMVENAYLLAQGHKVFVDPRLEVYGEAFFERYAQMLRDENAWGEAADEYGFRSAVVDLQARLNSFLWNSPAWRLVFFDECAAVFVRADAIGTLKPIRTKSEMMSVVESLTQRLTKPSAHSNLKWWERASSPAPYQRVGNFLAALGFFEAAEPFIAQAIAAYPYNASLSETLGHLRATLGDTPGAIDAYEEALRLEPALPNAAKQLARQYQKQGQARNAELALRRMLELNSEDAEGWAQLGAILIATGSYSDAGDCLRHAVNLEPNNQQYLKNLGKLQVVLGSLSEALLTLRRASDLAPGDHTLYRDMAAIRFRLGDKQGARKEIEAGLALRPDDVELLDLKGRLEGPSESESKSNP